MEKKKRCHTHTHNGILLGHKKNVILTFAATWMDFMQSEIIQRKTSITCYHLSMESKKIQQTSEYNKKRQIHRQREQTSGYQWGEGSRGNIG